MRDSGFSRDVDEICSLLCCYATCSGRIRFDKGLPLLAE